MPSRFTTTASSASAALRRAQARGVLPLDLSSAEIRRQVAKMIRENAVFSARTTNALYLQEVRERIARLMQGGFRNDLPKLRLELKQILAELGYTPETGFPGDEALGIPPAEPGSLRDLSSDARLNLLLTTQEELMRGAAQKARGLDGTRVIQFPAWELVRLGQREVPRGSPKSGTMGWPARFVKAGGVLRLDAEHRERMIALKSDPVWVRLGEGALFDDALDTDHPPFAFNSGMGWTEVHHSELSLLTPTLEPGETESREQEAGENVIPAPKASSSGLDAETIAALKRQVKGLEERDGSLLLKNRELSRQTLLRRMKRLAETGRAAA